MRWRGYILLLAVAFGATTGGVLAQKKPSHKAPSARTLLATAKNWGYQLQDIKIGPLAASDYDVLVIDAGTPAPGAELPRKEIARLKRTPKGGRRIVLAYLNVGEAEDYRYYWRPAWERSRPAWMGAENCRWKGDHRVRHWMKDWQALLFGSPKSYLGRIMDAGFDGVWLDRVDVYYAWFPETRWQAGADMVELVVGLSRWSKKRNPDFLVVPQNGEELLADPTFLAAVDGIGKEDILYGDNGNNVANHPERTARQLRNITYAQRAGLPVLAVEYVSKPDLIADARRRLAALGINGYIGPRSLSRLGPGETGHAEDRDTEPIRADAKEEC